MPPPPPAPHHAPYIHLASVVRNNLENQADWKELQLHATPEFPRPLLTGVPPEPIYSAESDNSPEVVSPESGSSREWVLPVDLKEKWSPRKSAEVFDSLPVGFWGVDRRGETLKKRLLLAVVSEDSTVVYYVMHDGIVKPRQN